jgi:hypothetical protein
VHEQPVKDKMSEDQQADKLGKEKEAHASNESLGKSLELKELELSGLKQVWGVCEENNEAIRSPAPLPAHASPQSRKFGASAVQKDKHSMRKSVLKRKVELDKNAREGSASPLPKRNAKVLDSVKKSSSPADEKKTKEKEESKSPTPIIEKIHPKK